MSFFVLVCAVPVFELCLCPCVCSVSDFCALSVCVVSGCVMSLLSLCVRVYVRALPVSRSCLLCPVCEKEYRFSSCPDDFVLCLCLLMCVHTACAPTLYYFPNLS